MAIEETLRLKVELDQSELGSELASIRTSVSSAASVQPASSVSEGGNGGHPSQRDSIFWGLGAATQQMTGDITSAASYANNVVATSLQTGAAVSQAFSGSQSFSPGYVSPTGNAPVQMGFGGALSQSIFGGNAAPSMSENQSDAMASEYFGNRFSGLSGDITGAQTGQAFAGAGGFWAGAAIGSAFGGLPGAIVGGIAGTVLGETVLSGGTRRLEDMQTLTGIGLSRSAAENAMGGGYWDGVGDSLSTGFGLWDYSKDHLAGVFQDGMDINGRTYKGTALAAVMLDKGLGDMSENNLKIGKLGLNQLVTRTGMDIGSAAEYMKSISGAGSQGLETATAMIGLLGSGNEVGMNTRYQNQFMGGMLEHGASQMSTQGHSAGMAAAINYTAGAYAIENTETAEMLGINSTAFKMRGIERAGDSFASTIYGQGTMALQAAFMTITGETNYNDAMIEMDKGGWTRQSLTAELRSMDGNKAAHGFKANMMRIGDVSGLEKAKHMIRAHPKREGDSPMDWINRLMAENNITEQQARNAITAAGESSVDVLNDTNSVTAKAYKAVSDFASNPKYIEKRKISDEFSATGWEPNPDKDYAKIYEYLGTVDFDEKDKGKMGVTGKKAYEFVKEVFEDDQSSLMKAHRMGEREKEDVLSLLENLNKGNIGTASGLTSKQQMDLGLAGINAGGDTLKSSMAEAGRALSHLANQLDSETYDNREK